jgi:glycosyltransferase involved in cell wall biosynthesis
LLGKPVIIHGRGNYHSVPPLQRVIERMLGPHTRYGLAVSASTRDYMVQQWHVPDAAVQVVYNGVPFDDIHPMSADWKNEFRLEWGCGPADKVLGIVGRLESFKGHREAFRALQQVRKVIPNVSIWVLGDGVFEQELHAWVKEQGMTDCVKFLGFRRDVREVIQCFDIQVFPGYREGTPNTLYEALAVGNAIIASRVDGQAELLVDEKTALMFEAGDVDKLAQQILRVLRNPELMTALRAASKTRSADFDGMRCVETIQRLYERIMAENPRRAAAP